ncbi:hypothetical protein BDW42DRAFT_164148 [Aspergillus taichungensis]|uniref:Uncharacterized protein n=1 Tax=Aspergillus taichungensis TaxID=482145 RepID=A0A2J5I1Y3_9EURO|nr:hypothetical protein BDW42DRAFT_164148 [Aspergillus taichungensis]
MRLHVVRATLRSTADHREQFAAILYGISTAITTFVSRTGLTSSLHSSDRIPRKCQQTATITHVRSCVLLSGQGPSAYF